MVLDPGKPEQIGYRIAQVIALERKAQSRTGRGSSDFGEAVNAGAAVSGKARPSQRLGS
jgi:hypothetical protein